MSYRSTIRTLQPYFPKIDFIVILPYTPRSSEWYLPSRLTNKNFLCISHLCTHATCPARLVRLDFVVVLISDEEFK
jgi:hypothetical protein